MNPKHLEMRKKLRKMPVPQARTILKKHLPGLEARVIFLSDVKKLPLLAVAEKLGYEESSIKDIRRRGYEKLAAREG